MNWQKRINRAEKRGEFTLAEYDMAESWTSCAVGEHRGEYAAVGTPGAFKYKPIDDKLDSLGGCFFVAVAGDDFVGARRLHAMIARRIAKVPA